MMAGFEQYTKRTRRAIFLEEMEQVVPWRKLCALGSRIIPSQGAGVQRWEWSACYALIVCSGGSTCPTQR